jgi:hypothetical protein
MKKNLFLITEEEKNRILSMHVKATSSQYLSEQEVPATPAPATPTPAPASNTEQAKILTFNDRDYAYKKEGEKYFFKLQSNPASPSAQNYKKQGKFLNWTEAKGKGLESIKKLDFKPETLNPLSVKDVKIPTTPETLSTTATAQTAAPVKPLATGGGSQVAGQQVTAQTNPEIAQDLKSAAQIRQEFRQGKRDLRKLQKEREKLYNTYNRLSDKMDKATSDSYLNNISQLDQLISQK